MLVKRETRSSLKIASCSVVFGYVSPCKRIVYSFDKFEIAYGVSTQCWAKIACECLEGLEVFAELDIRDVVNNV